MSPHSLTTYDVEGPRFIDPGWFNQVRHGQHTATVTAVGTVVLEQVELRLRSDAPAAGTPVKVWLNQAGFFVCATIDDLDAAELARRERVAAAEARERLYRHSIRAQAEAFNARIVIPVKWDVGIKDVLSGLTERSMGNGRNKATVEHIYLLEALQEGRLIRHPGDFLCTSVSGSNGKRWSSKIVERGFDGDDQPFQPKVTCKACLKIAQKWMTKP